MDQIRASSRLRGGITMGRTAANRPRERDPHPTPEKIELAVEGKLRGT